MRLTKGMKKALSMFLTSALVITGASVPATQTKAASAEKLTWEGTLKATGVASEDDWANITTSENFTTNDITTSFETWSGGGVGGWCGANMTSTLDLSAFEQPVIKVTYDNASDGVVSKGIQFCYELDGSDWKNSVYADAATGSGLTVEQNIQVGAEPDMQFVAVSPAAKKNVVITKIEIYDAAYVEEPSTSDDPGATDAPAANAFQATLQYMEPPWAASEDTVDVTNDGEYTLTTWAAEDAEESINMGWIETTLKNGDVSEDFKMSIKSIQLGTKLYTYSKTDDRYLGFKDQRAVSEDDENVPGTYRLNIKNQYNALFDTADHQTKVAGTKADMLKGAKISPEDYEAGKNFVNAGDVVQVKFTVEGLTSDKPAKTYTQIADKEAAVEDTVNAGEYGDVEYEVSTVENIEKPADPTTEPSTQPSTQPTVAPTQAPTTQPTVAPTQAPTTQPTVAPTQAPTTQPTVAPTKAPAKKATTNACTKVKAKKSKVTVKKGKKATLKFTVTAKKKTAKTTDKMTVTVKNKKIVSVTKKSLAKGSASVTVKGKKKGSTTVTVKVGKKSAKVTVKVKK